MSIIDYTPNQGYGTAQAINHSLFTRAARDKFRYESKKGTITTEDLFSLSLSNLDYVAQTIDAELDMVGKKSFVSTSHNPKKATLEAKLEVVKAVIAIKQQEAAEQQRRASINEQRERLQEALHQAELNQYASASPEELRRQLAALGG